MSALRPPMSAALETRPFNVNLQFIRESIETAQKKNCPQCEYTRAFVLFLAWAHDPIKENEHRVDLARLFTDIYGYAWEEYEIPDDVGTIVAYERVHKVLSWFMERHNAEDTLLIVVYHGFAHMRGGRCLWLADVAHESPAIDWSALRQMTLDYAQADMLYIFDCCYTLLSNHGRNYELLAATEVFHPKEVEWRHSSNSFTAKLVKILTTLDGEPATVVQIYALLMREVYLDLKKTFTIAPIHRRNSSREYAVKLQPLHTSSNIPEFRLHELLATAPKVLIKAFVQRPTPGVEVVEWRQFLMDSSTHIPSLEVSVEAVYQTDFKTWIMHLRIPVDIWALLWDHHPALRFDEFVMSQNVMDALRDIHGPFEKIGPFKTEDGLAVIKGGKGLTATKREDDSEVDSATDHIKREDSSDNSGEGSWDIGGADNSVLRWNTGTTTTDTIHKTVQENQQVNKKEGSSENMDLDNLVLQRNSYEAPGVIHGSLQGNEQVVMVQDELAATKRKHISENVDMDHGVISGSNQGRSVHKTVSSRLRKRNRSQSGKNKG